MGHNSTAIVGSDRGLLPASATAREINIGLALRTLWRRKLLLVGIVVVALVLVALVILAMTPRYTAQTLIMLEPRAPRLLQAEGMAAPITTDMASVETQMQLLESPAIAGEVIGRLQLYNDPEFNLALRRRDNPGLLGRLSRLTGVDWPAHLPDRWAEAVQRWRNSSTSIDKEAPTDVLIERFLSKLSVTTKGRSSVIGVAVTTEDPDKSARIANAIADAYLADQSAAKTQFGRQLSESLGERLEGLQHSVVEAEGAIEQYREQTGWTQGDGGTIIDQQLTEMSTQLIAARTEEAQAQARLNQFRASLKGASGDDAIPEVLNSPLIQNLRQQEADVLRRLGDLAAVYGNSHPKTINLRAELRDFRAKIGVETKKIIGALTTELERAEARVRVIDDALNELRAQGVKQNQAGVRLRELGREADAKRSVYTALLGRAQELAVQEGVRAIDARVIAPAKTPSLPSSPRILMTLATALIGSSLLGGFAILWREYRASGFQSKEEIEAVSGLPVFGLVPMVKRDALPNLTRGLLFEERNADFRDAIRSVYAGLSLHKLPGPRPLAIDRRGLATVVLVTSSVPGEGKSLLSLSLARQAARSRKRALLLDCDFRRPTAAAMAGAVRNEGVAQLLQGEAQLDDVLHIEEISGAHVVSSGVSANGEAESQSRGEVRDLLPDLVETRLPKLLKDIARNYDFIVIDSSPIMAAPDALVLSQIVDETIFVVRWRRTRGRVVIAALQQLTDLGAKVRGVVLSQVDTQAYAKYGFTDSDTFLDLYRQYK
jgi:polysaccharide biosynthesis transport protein